MATTTVTATNIEPGPSESVVYLFLTAATADSGDTVDVSAYVNTIQFLMAWDQDDGDSVTCTESSGTLTIDAAGGETDTPYGIICVGTKV